MASRDIANTPEELLDLARAGLKLKPKQRQAVITWLEASNKMEEYGLLQLTQILQCKASSVRTYIQKARQQLAAAITEESAMEYMRRFLSSYELLATEARKQVKECPAGTGAHLGYMRLLKEIEAEKIEKLQSIGVIPKELGRLTAIKEEWKAEVSESGVASVRQIVDGDDEPA